jgi:hypothetical protein
MTNQELTEQSYYYFNSQKWDAIHILFSVLLRLEIKQL